MDMSDHSGIKACVLRVKGIGCCHKCTDKAMKRFHKISGVGSVNVDTAEDLVLIRGHIVPSELQMAVKKLKKTAEILSSGEDSAYVRYFEQKTNMGRNPDQVQDHHRLPHDHQHHHDDPAAHHGPPPSRPGDGISGSQSPHLNNIHVSGDENFSQGPPLQPQPMVHGPHGMVRPHPHPYPPVHDPNVMVRPYHHHPPPPPPPGFMVGPYGNPYGGPVMYGYCPPPPPTIPYAPVTPPALPSFVYHQHHQNKDDFFHKFSVENPDACTIM